MEHINILIQISETKLSNVNKVYQKYPYRLIPTTCIELRRTGIAHESVQSSIGLN